MTGRPLVSVVVTTKDVGRTLDACLASVRAQDYPAVEVVVVDNSSQDDTLAIAHHYADVVRTAGPERSAQRNLGAALASGAYVLWLDADMVLAPGAIGAAVDLAAGTGAVVAIPERTVGTGFWTRCRALERSCYVDDPWLHNPRLLSRELLQGIGGFNVDMAGPEDADLRHRLRAAHIEIALTDVLIEHDEGRLTLRDVVRKRVYYGRSLPAFAEANPGRVSEQGAATLRAFWRHRRRLATEPLPAAGMLVLRAVEAGSYAVGAWLSRRSVR